MAVENVFWHSIRVEKGHFDTQGTENSIVLGFDGIIDDVWKVVKRRSGRQTVEYFSTMEEFGEAILDRKGTGLSHELVRKRRNAGGFTANTGRAIGRLGFKPSLIGAYGVGSIEPEFQELQPECLLVSFGTPVISNILEFQDGKIMLPHLHDSLNLTWDVLAENVGLLGLREAFGHAVVASIGYWSNTPHFDELLVRLSEEVFCTAPPHFLFFDFGNVTKKTTDELLSTLNLLRTLDERIPVILSLNDAEARNLFACYGRDFTLNDLGFVAANALGLQDEIGITELVIHTTRYAVSARASSAVILEQDFCKRPVRTTGAGDTFNGGYIVALAQEMDQTERLAVANACTSFFVRNGYPPSVDELLSEIERITRTLSNNASH